MKTSKMLLFDIDGTLLLTGGVGKIALEAAILELFGIPDSWGNLIPDGKTDPMIISEICFRILKRNLMDEEYHTLCSRYHHHFENEISHADRFRLMPGIPELLGTLAGNPCLVMGLATGNFGKAAEMKLKRGNLDVFFSFGGFASDSEDRRHLTRIAYERGLRHCKEELPPERVFVIGDTVHDITAGKSLGAITISVATGSTPPPVLMDQRPDYFFEDLTDAEKFLELLG